jgi:hypothetical protein
MDSEAQRTLHGITWRDELAWMEDMKGDRWATFIKTQQAKWDTLVETEKETIPLFSAELEAAKKISAVPMFRAGGTVEIGVGGTFSMMWRWTKENKVHGASELQARKGYVWAIEEIGNGAEVYAVRLYKKGKETPIWEKRGVAPFVAVVGDRCYCLLAKNKLIYYTLISWQAYTGIDEKIHYVESDYRYNLELLRGDDEHAYLRRQAGGKQDAFLVLESNITLLEPISLESRRFVFGSHTGEYLYWSKEQGWKASRALLTKKLSLPSFQKEVPEHLDTRKGLLVTKWQGCRTLWKLRKSAPCLMIWRNYGQVLLDPWDGSWGRITQPGVDVVWWDSASSERPHTAFAWGRQSFCKFAKSLDGTSIPFLLTRPTKPAKPRGLLVVGYGAYGMSTPFSTSRWEPLLKRGWAVAIGLWRGGGDHTPEWEDAGRVHGRVLVLEDAEAVVKAAQKITGCSAKSTVLYGRSAGGLWVGGLVAKYPTGALARGAYMEVPYLDVLRTITNRSLPLTNIEADEFGLPEQRLSDFVSALEWSPMERLPEGGVKGVWQIVRTGLNDSEVFAYESAKWVERCGPSSHLAVEGGQGHFVSGAIGLNQQASDLAVLLKLADN